MTRGIWKTDSGCVEDWPAGCKSDCVILPLVRGHDPWYMEDRFWVCGRLACRMSGFSCTTTSAVCVAMVTRICPVVVVSIPRSLTYPVFSAPFFRINTWGREENEDIFL